MTRGADGRLTPSKCRLSAEFTPGEQDGELTLANVNVYAADVYAAGSDVRAVLQMDAVFMREETLRFVGEVREDAEAFSQKPARPSITIVRAEPGQSMWELARRCGSSEEAILSANGGRQDGVLLVPKSR